MDDRDAFAALVSALRPWLPHLVFVGGWAHRLHRVHPLAEPPVYMPITTLDADVALSLTPPLEGDIGAALEAANFRVELSSDHEPPVTEYRFGGDEHGFYAEFLAPLRGSGRKRDGTPDATVALAGVTAQKLRYLEILMSRPWAVRIGADVGFPLPAPTDLSIPNPTSFITQRLLIQNARPAARQAQDALYIHDTLELFGSHLEELRTIWLTEVRPGLSDGAVRMVERMISQQFGSTTDVIRSAARIPKDRVLRPERLRAVCAAGLEEIFSAD